MAILAGMIGIVGRFAGKLLLLLDALLLLGDRLSGRRSAGA